MRRIEAGTWIEDMVKQGYDKGSWAHIKQSDKVLMKAWFAEETRLDESKRRPKEWRTPKVGGA